MDDEFMEFLMVSEIADGSMNNRKNKPKEVTGSGTNKSEEEFIPPSDKIKVIDGTTYEIVRSEDGKAYNVLKNRGVLVRGCSKKLADNVLKDILRLWVWGHYVK